MLVEDYGDHGVLIVVFLHHKKIISGLTFLKEADVENAILGSIEQRVPSNE